MASFGMKESDICNLLGISSRTLQRRKHEDERIQDAIEKGKSEGAFTATRTLAQMIKDKNLGALCFYLKTQHGWDDRQYHKHEHEHSGAIDNRIVVQMIRPDNGRRVIEDTPKTKVIEQNGSQSSTGSNGTSS